MKRRLRPIVFVICAVAVFRLSLIGRGAMAYLDETNYFKAALALDALRHGHLSTAIFHLSWNSARPGLAVIQLIPAALQAIPFAFGVSPSNPRSLIIPVAFNVVASFVVLYMFWRLSVLLFDGDETAATIATGIYGLLANTNAYVRHLLAMEPALAIGMIALWLAVSRPKHVRVAFAVGALALATVTVYPGYYLLAAIVGVAFIGSAGERTWTDRMNIGAPFAAGAALVLVAVELFCRIGGVSYVERLNWLSGRIDNGSFDEGWAFLPRYMLQVEHSIGAVLLAGSLIYVLVFIVTVARTRRVRTIDWLVIPSILAWIFQAVNAAQLHKMVLYGRLIHPWMAFMVWATLDLVRRIAWRTVRVMVFVTAIVASIVSWLAWAPEYRRLDYPLDALYRLGINTALVPAAQQRCDMWPWNVYTSPAPLNRETGVPYATRTNWVLVNFCFGPRTDAGLPSDAALSKMNLRYRARHFVNVKMYEFESFTPEERAALEREPLELRVYLPE